ncbi:MAG: hypothetical protein HYU75_26570, partial [Betaproteobacteria bacterium]|nr:hypothetical protein [Betaproteobacteria bacterium]
MDESKYDAIVGAIYDVALEPLRLTSAVALVVDAIKATGAHLVGLNKATGEVVLSSITGFPLLGEIDYSERYGKLDPRAPVSLAAPEGSWVSCHHHITQAFVDRSEFYQDFLIPYGSRWVSLGKFLDTPDYAIVLGVHQGPERKPLDEGQLEFLRRLTPHFCRAMRLLHEASRLGNQWAVVKATLDGLDYAATVCTSEAEILVPNEAAGAILD